MACTQEKTWFTAGMKCFLAWCFVSVVMMTLGIGRERPNVVLIYTDDQGTLDAGCYGSSDLITPHIDQLAATGVRFTQAYGHTVCCPSRAALMTGRYPQRGGVQDWTQGSMSGPQGINMALEEVTLAEVLREAGYRTALFGKWHLGAHRDFGPEKQGFDEFFGIRGGFIDNYNHFFLHGNGFHDLYEGSNEVFKRDQYFPELVVTRSLEYIEKHRQQPFFLYCALNIPHYPEQALAEQEKRYAHLADPARRAYGAMVSTTDHCIGQIVRKLEELQLRENTIIIVMSDNGHSEETGVTIRTEAHASGLPKGHPYGANGAGSTGKWIGHKGTFLEGGIRVPAIVSFPAKLPQGQVRDQAITSMDWFPTITELCGIVRKNDAPPLDGHSLLPVIRSAEAPSPYQGVLHFGWRGSWAVREGDWKLISMAEKGAAKMSLHNLAEEKPEQKDYLTEKPAIVARLQSLHEAWAREVTPRK